MSRVPYNGYLEIWLQRVIQPKSVNVEFISDESICQIVNGKTPVLWESDWIASSALKEALDVSKIVIASVQEIHEVVQTDEIELFKQNAWSY